MSVLDNELSSFSRFSPVALKQRSSLPEQLTVFEQLFSSQE